MADAVLSVLADIERMLASSSLARPASAAPPHTLRLHNPALAPSPRRSRPWAPLLALPHHQAGKLSPARRHSKHWQVCTRQSAPASAAAASLGLTLLTRRTCSGSSSNTERVSKRQQRQLSDGLWGPTLLARRDQESAPRDSSESLDRTGASKSKPTTNTFPRAAGETLQIRARIGARRWAFVFRFALKKRSPHSPVWTCLWASRPSNCSAQQRPNGSGSEGQGFGRASSPFRQPAGELACQLVDDDGGHFSSGWRKKMRAFVCACVLASEGVGGAALDAAFVCV